MFGMDGFGVIAFMGVLACLEGPLLREKSRRELLRLPRSCHVDPKAAALFC